MKYIITESQYNLLLNKGDENIKFLVNENSRGAKVFKLKLENNILAFALANFMFESKNGEEYYLQNLQFSNSEYFDILMNEIIDYFKTIEVKKVWMRVKTDNISKFKDIGFIPRKLTFPDENEHYGYIWIYINLR